MIVAACGVCREARLSFNITGARTRAACAVDGAQQPPHTGRTPALAAWRAAFGGVIADPAWMAGSGREARPGWRPGTSPRGDRVYVQRPRPAGHPLSSRASPGLVAFLLRFDDIWSERRS